MQCKKYMVVYGSARACVRGWVGGWSIRRVMGERYYTGDWQQSGVKKINGMCFPPATQFTTRDKPPTPPSLL